ncbi:MAG: glycosyltransferase [Hyphomicrobium sp.]|uniref:glycosyltransferase family 2 protein n=1 Tax=Hyphomicrobium sp. TaxID=82 RepID=UPI0039E68894
MKAAIIIPAYEAEATIASSIRSLLRQRDAATLDIIVIDDGSSDRTCAVVRELMASEPEIRLIENAHGGISKTRNAGLKALSEDTDVVSFLDADDLSPDGRMKRDIAILEADAAIDLIYAKVRFFDFEDQHTLSPRIGANAVDGRVVQLAAGLYRRTLIDRVGLFDETLVQSEDLDYLMRIFEERPNYFVSDEVGVYYRKNNGGITEQRKQAQHELMRALFRARKRRSKLAGFEMPRDIFSSDHLADLERWAK